MSMLYIFAAITLIGFSQATFPLFASTDNEYLRFKRDIATQKENNCTLSCLKGMDENFNKTYNASSSRSYWDDEKYEEKHLDKLCKAYEPSSKCLNQCPKENFKTIVVGSFSMLEFMCISHNKEAKQQLPCLNKVHEETRKTCNPKCQSYKQALKKWETLRMTPELIRDKFDELAEVFSKSCSYEKCEKDCSSPMIINKCGNDGKSFTDAFWRSMLESLNNTTMITNIISGLRGKSFPLCQNGSQYSDLNIWPK